MGFFAQYGIFLLKSLTIVFSIIFLFAGIFSVSRKPKPKVSITHLNKHYNELKEKVQKEVHKKKVKKVKSKKEDNNKPCLYLIDFEGDIKASQVESLRDEITTVLSVANKQDEVVVRVTSPGGTVNGYGLAASQLQRIRDQKIKLTVCIDKVAASGGYLMACVAEQIIAAPFAILGSIGVVAQMPNFHRLLQKNNIDVELMTAGEYKRTLTMFGENTDKGRKKFQEDIESIHQVFRDYVLKHRSQLDIDKVATGEHWLATDAINLNLIDKLQTSDEYIISNLTKYNAYKVEIQAKQSLVEKLLRPAAKLLHPFA